MRHNVLLTLAIGSAEKTHLGEGCSSRDFQEGRLVLGKEGVSREVLAVPMPARQGGLARVWSTSVS